MTLEEAIKHCEEVAYQNEILMKQYDDASGYNRSHNENIRTDGAKGCEQLISLYRQLAEWLRELKAYRNIRQILSQNRIATDRYGDVVLWSDIKRVLEEVNADADSSKENQYKTVALELLQKYVDSEETVCSEFSGNFFADRLRLEKTVKNYLKRLDAEDKYEKITEENWIFEIEGSESE